MTERTGTALECGESIEDPAYPRGPRGYGNPADPFPAGLLWVDILDPGVSSPEAYFVLVGPSAVPAIRPLTEARHPQRIDNEVSTAPAEMNRPEGIERLVDDMFESAREQDFEDGMSSHFSDELLLLVRKYGNRAMQEISYLVTRDSGNSEVSSEALRWLGRMQDTETYGWRLWLLEKSLSSKSPLVRDAAGLGLASMGDRHAVPFVKKAIARESCPELRADLIQLLGDLKAGSGALVAEKDPQSEVV